jgi:BlaI family penicillinase repressor
VVDFTYGGVMSRRYRLGDLQLAIMQVLWARKEATSSEVHAALLAEHGLAPTTIATMLRKMEEKGVVAHRVEGRGFIYRPTVGELQVQQTMVGELVGRLFRGDPAALVSHLLVEGEIDPGELAALESAVAEAREELQRQEKNNG